MANRVIDIKPPETMVLLTGDGSGYTDGKGFIRQLERAHNNGWEVEVISWDAGCNRNLKAFAQKMVLIARLNPRMNKLHLSTTSAGRNQSKAINSVNSVDRQFS